MLAVDGSELSNRAVEHVGDVFSQCSQCGHLEITLLHVLDLPPSLREHQGAGDPDEERRLEEDLMARRQAWLEERRKELEETIFEPARRILKSKGISGERVKIRTKVAADAHSDEAYAIVNETRLGDHGILVLGRRGKSTLQEFIMGSVVHKVMHQAKNFAVWVVE
jgi:nucleotide-binding universal stress UspA family protein